MRATVMYGAGDVRVDTVPTYIEELLPTFHRDVQRGREHDLRPLGEGRGRYPSHDRLPPDLPKGRPTSALMMIVRFLRRGGGLRRDQHGRSGGQRGCRVGDGDDRTTARRFGRPRAARRVAHGARDGARGNGGRLEHPAAGVATSALHLNFAAQGIVALPGAATAMFVLGRGRRGRTRVAEREARDGGTTDTKGV